MPRKEKDREMASWGPIPGKERERETERERESESERVHRVLKP